MLKCSHIRNGVNTFLMMESALRIQHAVRYLQARGDVTLANHPTCIRNIALTYGKIGDRETLMRTLLDENGRPITISYTHLSIDISQDFVAWSAEQSAAGKDVSNMVYHAQADGDGDGGDGRLHAGVRDEHTWIYTLKLNDRGPDTGARSHCKAAGILIPPHPSCALLREKLHAYHVASGEEAGRTAAALVTSVSEAPPLPTPPAGVNHNARMLHGLLMVEAAPVLLLERLCRTRASDSHAADMIPHSCDTNPDAGCSCTERHVWFVMAKAMRGNMFLRNQGNYQRALTLFIYFCVLTQRHPDAMFTNLVFRHVRCSLALSIFGDPTRCQPGDLHQEEHNIAVAKEASSRCPSAYAHAEARVLVASWLRLQEAQQRPRETNKRRRARTAISSNKQQREAEHFAAMLVVAQVFVDQVLDEGVQPNGDSSTLIAGTSLHFRDTKRMWMRVETTGVQAHRAALTTVAGLKVKLSYAIRQSAYPPLQTMHDDSGAKKKRARHPRPTCYWRSNGGARTKGWRKRLSARARFR